MGHDLVLEAMAWSASLRIDPGGAARSQLVVTVDARSLQVSESVGGVKPLAGHERDEIHRNIADKVLRSARHPEIVFVSDSLGPAAGADLVAAGDLTITGVTRRVRFPIAVEHGADGLRLRGTVALLQSDWGIRPFGAFLGALRVADRVEVSGEATLALR